MADIGYALDKVAGMLGAKSGAQLGAENKAKAKAAAAKKETDAADRSPGTAIRQSQDTMEAAMKELNLQNKRAGGG